MNIYKKRKIVKRENMEKIARKMKMGFSYRPCDFNIKNVSEQTVWAYLNEMEDQGYIRREIVNGKVLFFKVGR